MFLFVVYYLQDGIVGFIRTLFARKVAKVLRCRSAPARLTKTPSWRQPTPPARGRRPAGRRRHPDAVRRPEAINQVDIRIKRGTIHGLIGPNGSGKSR
jgi:branched-chain amino acid transport system permease protein